MLIMAQHINHRQHKLNLYVRETLAIDRNNPQAVRLVAVVNPTLVPQRSVWTRDFCVGVDFFSRISS